MCNAYVASAFGAFFNFGFYQEGLYYHLVSSQVVPEPENAEDTTDDEAGGEQQLVAAKESLPISEVKLLLAMYWRGSTESGNS